VTALPRHLASWATQLALFPEHIALSLGPMVSRIAALVGGWRHDYAPHGTPDGHAGIDTRGRYDRLLATEWALLEELPDEFLRRAVSGEHLFLQRAYQDLTAARQSIVLFDAGPDQLGAPRLAHLAILIVLAQRAAAHDASLQWGTFQDRDKRLVDGVTKSNVRHLLGARSDQPVAADDIHGWMASDALRSASEIWFIGGEPIALTARERAASALIVSEMLDPGTPSRIRVTAASPQQAGVREAILDVPPGPAAVQALRDPFDTHVAGRQTTSHAIAPNSNMLFSPDGRKLYVRGVGGEVIAVQIPNSPRGTVGRPWAFAAPAGHAILAVGQSWSKRRVVVLAQQENELTIHVLSKRGGLANQVWRCTAVNYQLPQPTDGMPLRPLGFFDPGLCFIDYSGNLVELDGDRFWLRDEAACSASRAAHGAFVYIRSGQWVPQAMVARANRSREIEISQLEAPLRPMDSARYYFGAYGLAKLVACGEGEAPCLVVRGTQQTEIQVPRTHSVIGMIERGSDAFEPFVIAIDAGRTRIEAFGRTGQQETLLTTTTAISFAAVSDAEPVIGFITRSGELGVYSCRAGAMVLQIAGGRT
jgi:hypothetical protein